MHDLDETIVAVATPPGRGGVGCVRLSGPDARGIAHAVFRPARRQPESGAPRFGRFFDRQRRQLDHGFLVLFPEGRSFTGESTAELWPHGSPAVLAELVAAAIDHGARPAGPGEFTYRALRNGRLDLPRAEAVRDLVHARTLYQARVAFAQAEGALSERLAPLRELLEEWIARAEAAVEFVDESETHLPAGAFAGAIERAAAGCDELLDGFRTGRVVRDGAALVIAGRPNVGKSSLFNKLLARERAIVTDIAGTTRDTLEEQLDLDGIPVRLVDTAGLRQVSDPVESEGVRRADRARKEADLVLLVLDGSREPEPEELATLGHIRAETGHERTVVVVNKADLEPPRGAAGDSAAAGADPYAGLPRVSALTGHGVDELRRALRRCLVGTGPLEDPIVTNARHAAALERAREALARAAEAQAAGLSEELVLEDLRQAMRRLGEITGEFTNEELYDRIFSTFCIGK
jgi:tRNA modification GTPase